MWCPINGVKYANKYFQYMRSNSSTDQEPKTLSFLKLWHKAKEKKTVIFMIKAWNHLISLLNTTFKPSNASRLNCDVPIGLQFACHGLEVYGAANDLAIGRELSSVHRSQERPGVIVLAHLTQHSSAAAWHTYSRIKYKFRKYELREQWETREMKLYWISVTQFL